MKHIIYPTQRKIRTFLLLFLGVHFVQYLLIVLIIGGFWDGPLTAGLPFTVYTFHCGMAAAFNDFDCPVGWSGTGILWNMVFWYVITMMVHRKEKQL